MEKQNLTRRRFTPEKIEELDEYGVFVFGSNLKGDHAGGAARTAVEKFGAVMGQAEGLQGRSYAIPTLDKDMQRLPIESIRSSIETLYRFAYERPELDFYVTRIGCGIAGFEESEIAGVFMSFEFTPFNVILPMEFSAIRGIKGFRKGMVCSCGRNIKQYRENEEFVEDDARACECGMHYVENPLEVFGYYHPVDGSEYAAVTGCGRIDSHKGDSKIAVSHLRVGARISLREIWKMGLEFCLKKSSFITNRLLRRTIPIKSAQNYSTLAARNGNTLAAQDYSTLAARNGNTLAAQDYSALAAQNYSTLAAQNYSTLAARDGSTLAAQDSSTLAARDGSTLAARDCSTLAARDSSTLAARDYSTLAAQDGNTLAAQDYSTLAARNGNTLAAQDSSALAAQNYSTLAARDGSALAAQNCSTLAARDYSTLACRYNGIIEMFGTGNIAIGANGTKMRGKKGNAICLAEIGPNGTVSAVKAAIIDGKILKEDVFYVLKDGEFTEAE